MLRSCLLFLCLSLCAPFAWSQTVDSTQESFALSQGATVPTYVVPVLRLVSKTHVEPTTGLVLSESGLVLVPAGFASSGDEIVVLDGGTDIVSNGRTARIERNFPMDGLQVLSVYGLKRAAAPFAAAAPSDGDPVALTAFPPAEQIAEGAQPVDAAATLTVFGSGADPAVSGGTPLPNVTGPLLDRCGNVVAFSIANDVQTMETSPGTRYQWRDTLLGIIERLGLEPAPTACVAETETPEPEPEPEPEPMPVEPVQPVEEAEPAGQQAEEVVEETRQAPAEEPKPEILPPVETHEAEEPVEPPAGEVPAGENTDGPGGWAWLLLGAALAAAGIGLRRYQKGLAAKNARMEEPGSDHAIPAPEPEEAVPGGNAEDSVVTVRGSTIQGRSFEASCRTSSRAVNVVIGRGQVDLKIDSHAVSRRHAALNGVAGELTITDLGSNNGTSINGVPCLEGEIMYLQPGDTVTLGDVRFTVELSAEDDDG